MTQLMVNQALDRTIKPARIRKLEHRLRAVAERELLPLLDQESVDICATYGAIFPAYVEALWLKWVLHRPSELSLC